MNTNDTDELLEKWFKTKSEISLLEKKCDKYKRCAEKIMEELDKNTISSSNYTLKKVDMSRNTISKNDVPSEIWNKYSKKSSFSSYYLNSKTKKSPKRKKSSVDY